MSTQRQQVPHLRAMCAVGAPNPSCGAGRRTLPSLLHERPRYLPNVEAGQKRIAKRQHCWSQLVLAADAIDSQITQTDKRVGEARDGCLGHAGSRGQFGIAELGVPWREAVQHLKPTRQGRCKLSVVGKVVRQLRTGFMKSNMMVTA